MKKIDLHMHSNYSDDADLPVDHLVQRCISNGVDIISITDHNSIKSINEVKKQALSGNKITIIPGTEIDCSFQGKNFHILGYGIDNDLSDFELIEKNFIELQLRLTPLKIEKLKTLGFFIDEEKLYRLTRGKIPQEEQMAELILQDDRNKSNKLLLPYRKGGERSNMPLINFYWDFFGYGKTCYIAANYPQLERIVEIIKDNKGIPIIAHLGANIKNDYAKTLNDMLSIGVEGIEVFSSYHKDELADFLYEYACSKNRLVSCGSDFHGKNKPEIDVGNCSYHYKHYPKIMNLVELLT